MQSGHAVLNLANTTHAAHTSTMPRTPRTTTSTRTWKSQQQRRLDALAALDDPSRLTVSLSQAALLLGMSVSTACNAARTTGRLTDDVPVVRVAGTTRARYVVAKSHLLRVLPQSSTTHRTAPDDGLVP